MNSLFVGIKWIMGSVLGGNRVLTHLFSGALSFGVSLCCVGLVGVLTRVAHGAAQGRSGAASGWCDDMSQGGGGLQSERG